MFIYKKISEITKIPVHRCTIRTKHCIVNQDIDLHVECNLSFHLRNHVVTVEKQLEAD